MLDVTADEWGTQARLDRIRNGWLAVLAIAVTVVGVALVVAVAWLGFVSFASPALGAPVISELLYDAVGSDDAQVFAP